MQNSLIIEQIIEQIKSFKIYDRDIYYIIDFNLYKNFKLYYENVQVLGYWQFGEYFILYKKNGGTILLQKDVEIYRGDIDINLGIVKTLNSKSRLYYNCNYKLFDNGDYEFINGYYDLEQSTLQETKFRNLNIRYQKFTYLFGEHINENSIFAANLELKILWETPISIIPDYFQVYKWLKPRIEQFCGVYNDILWMVVNGQRLWGLDIHTGEQRHLIEDIVKGGGENLLDENTGIIQAFAGDVYAEFDLNTLTFKKQKRLDKDWFIRSCKIYKGDPLIYFCGHFEDVGNINVYGIYDTRVDKIIWHKIRDVKGQQFYDPPQANDKIMAILDNYGKLYIYDKMTLFTD